MADYMEFNAIKQWMYECLGIDVCAVPVTHRVRRSAGDWAKDPEELDMSFMIEDHFMCLNNVIQGRSAPNVSILTVGEETQVNKFPVGRAAQEGFEMDKSTCHYLKVENTVQFTVRCSLPSTR